MEEPEHLQTSRKAYHVHVTRILNKVEATLDTAIDEQALTYLRTAITQLQKKKEQITTLDQRQCGLHLVQDSGDVHAICLSWHSGSSIVVVGPLENTNCKQVYWLRGCLPLWVPLVEFPIPWYHRVCIWGYNLGVSAWRWTKQRIVLAMDEDCRSTGTIGVTGWWSMWLEQWWNTVTVAAPVM